MNGDFWPLLGFAVALSITPGPENLRVAAAAATHGVTDTVPHIVGAALGFALMLAVATAGLGGLLLVVPALRPVLQWAGGAWLCYLAWKIATTVSPEPGGSSAKPLGFIDPARRQWVDPHAWVTALAAAGVFVVPGRSLELEAARVAGIFAVVAIPCILPWAMLGGGTARILTAPHQLRAFSVTMAALLVVSVVPMLLR